MAYSTTLNLDSDIITIRNSIIAGNTDSAIYNSKISEVNYKSFIEDDMVLQVPTTVYTGTTGIIYKEAIQSIIGSYYSPSVLTLSEIITSMQAITATDTIAVLDAREALNFVLSVHGKSPSLLREFLVSGYSSPALCKRKHWVQKGL